MHDGLWSEQQHAKGRDQRSDRRPFLDRPGAGEARDQRKQGAQHEEHHARHHGHVIAGHMAIGSILSKSPAKYRFFAFLLPSGTLGKRMGSGGPSDKKAPAVMPGLVAWPL